MKPLISIITPVYNCVKYLKECIESILQQKYSDFKLILIDDGSTDGAGEICDEYANTDSRITVIHTVNQGVGLARNVGLDLVDTEYVAMVDADDILHPLYLEVLLNDIIKINADYIFGEFISFKDIDDINFKSQKNYKINVYTQEQAVDILCKKYYAAFITPQKIYKTKLFKNIRYPNEKVNVDEWVIHHLILNTKTIAISSARLYYYRLSPEGMTRNFSLNKISGVKACLDRWQLIGKLEKYKIYNSDLALTFLNKAITFYQNCLKYNLNCKTYMHDLKKYFKKAYKEGVKVRRDLYSRKDRLKFYLFVKFLSIYKLLYYKD